MVLGKLPVPGRPTIWITVGQGPTALAVGAGGGCLDIFTLIYPFFPISPSLWETARYRLKYCLKGPLNPKTYQATNLLIWIIVGQGRTALAVGTNLLIWIIVGQGPSALAVGTNLLIWIIVGQGPTALAVGAGGGCFDIFFSRLSFLSSFSLSLGEGPI